MSVQNKTYSTEEAGKIFRTLRKKKSNKVCFDCPTSNPKWASSTYGIYLCMNCAAIHRRMGVHISFVRSTVLDKWMETELMTMMEGGNKNATEFFKSKGWSKSSGSSGSQKYESRAAKEYKAQLGKNVSLHRSELKEQIDAALSANSGKNPALKRSVSGGHEGLDDILGSFGDATTISSSSAPAPSSRKPKPVKKVEKKGSPNPVLQQKAKTVPVRKVVVSSKASKASATASSASTDQDEEITPMSLGKSKRSTGARRKNKASLLSSAPAASSSASSSSALNRATSCGSDIDSFSFDSWDQPAPVKKKEEVKEESESDSEPEPVPRSNKKGNDSDTEEVPSKYSNSTSISSDQYFGRGDYSDDYSSGRKLEQFANANAIGSDAFFDREPKTSESDMSSKVEQLGDAVSSFVSNLRSSWQ